MNKINSKNIIKKTPFTENTRTNKVITSFFNYLKAELQNVKNPNNKFNFTESKLFTKIKHLRNQDVNNLNIKVPDHIVKNENPKINLINYLADLFKTEIDKNDTSSLSKIDSITKEITSTLEQEAKTTLSNFSNAAFSLLKTSINLASTAAKTLIEFTYVASVFTVIGIATPIITLIGIKYTITTLAYITNKEPAIVAKGIAQGIALLFSVTWTLFKFLSQLEFALENKIITTSLYYATPTNEQTDTKDIFWTALFWLSILDQLSKALTAKPAVESTSTANELQAVNA